jgi:hypothetical protein
MNCKADSSRLPTGLHSSALSTKFVSGWCCGRWPRVVVPAGRCFGPCWRVAADLPNLIISNQAVHSGNHMHRLLYIESPEFCPRSADRYVFRAVVTINSDCFPEQHYPVGPLLSRSLKWCTGQSQSPMCTWRTRYRRELGVLVLDPWTRCVHHVSVAAILQATAAVSSGSIETAVSCSGRQADTRTATGNIACCDRTGSGRSLFSWNCRRVAEIMDNRWVLLSFPCVCR